MAKEKTPSSIDVALDVLRESQRPMRTTEIVDIGMREYGLVMGGKTPKATLDANFCNERKRRARQGRQQRFVRIKRGYWGLTEYVGKYYNVEEGVKQPEE